MNLILTLDIGTSEIKAALFSEKLKLLSVENVKVEKHLIMKCKLVVRMNL